MKRETQILTKTSVINCGLATAVINGLISYFTLEKVDALANGSVTFNFLGVAIGCGLICPLFGGMTLKGVLGKNSGLDLGRKKEHIIAKFIPNQLLLGICAIGLCVTALLWGVPYLVAMCLKLNFYLPRIVWVVSIGIYSGIVASFATYLGMLRVYFAKAS